MNFLKGFQFTFMRSYSLIPVILKKINDVMSKKVYPVLLYMKAVL